MKKALEKGAERKIVIKRGEKTQKTTTLYKKRKKKLERGAKKDNEYGSAQQTKLVFFILNNILVGLVGW